MHGRHCLRNLLRTLFLFLFINPLVQKEKRKSFLLYAHLLFSFFFTLDAGLLARSQYSEGPATGHLDTGFSWFPCV